MTILDLSAAARATRRLARQPETNSYTQLSRQVRERNLLRRTPTFYSLLFAGLVLALGGAIAGFVLLGHSWLQLLIAGALGIIFTQFAFLSHEAAHRAIFTSGPANDRVGRLLGNGVVGMSYSWWMNKHSRHHANPNRIGKDPDIEEPAISFYSEEAATRTGWRSAIATKQGYFFFPLLLLEGLNLHLASIRSLVTVRPTKERVFELALIFGRFALYLAAVFWVLPFGMAFAFLGVQFAIFGLYMGSSFAVNHKGMPIVPSDVKLDFLSRQVRTSRNIRGRVWPTILMGGLNYQVEHHLFPSMARPHLAATRRLVRAHCEQEGVPYTEMSLLRSYRTVVTYLNDVGLSARDPFACPVAARLGRE
ncbi:acyl-CoA desaturase [Microlunatus sp. Gsoil 973]|jgi:fatty acid desaturase|uniref:fatty acid desaturase family protein n=1 Tax=Microlunatus sp. Gsoil 973 TaxID=2672569 RepID=UPI0012B4FE14|nr:acyl-CoA desaturase [Microlunatus sp. Gsoil 973]QGN33423.1 acyl-CoA desaturase [Microlunatus sp. Gsoil 973]